MLGSIAVHSLTAKLVKTNTSKIAKSFLYKNDDNKKQQ
jgi:hypothetical protein